MIELDTKCGKIIGNERMGTLEFLGVRYAHSKRFEYAKLVESWDREVYDARKNGASFMQKRVFNLEPENKSRAFYQKEFRDGMEFEYSEDAHFLNIWAPKEGKKHPVIVFIHGGAFESCSISESNVDGLEYAKRGVIMVAIQYRLGVFGSFTNESIYEKNSRDGNFGLDDCLKAIEWVRNNIESFGGDKENITLMGQSAGAMSIQMLCVSKKAEGLFKNAIMISGSGLFPKPGRPIGLEESRKYFKEVMKLSGRSSVEEFRNLDPKAIFEAQNKMPKNKRGTKYSMPVIDGYLLEDDMKRLIRNPHKINYMVSFTNKDMFTALLAHMTLKYARGNNAYCYFFDIDAKGDDSKAFHSADLRYVQGSLDRSWRPYDEKDYAVSSKMIDYISNFARTGDPNGENLPRWERRKGECLIIRGDEIRMGKPNWLTLIKNTF